jgi:phage FluMu protein Com
MTYVVKHPDTSPGHKLIASNHFQASRGTAVVLRCRWCGKALAKAYVEGTRVRFPATLGFEVSNFDENEDGTFTYRCSRSKCEAPLFRIPRLTVAKQAQSAAESGIRSIRIGPPAQGRSLIHPY